MDYLAIALEAVAAQERAKRPKRANPADTPAGREAVARFGFPAAALFPLLGRRVSTPRGPGRLLQVLGATAAVHLDADRERVAYMPWTSVAPDQGDHP